MRKGFESLFAVVFATILAVLGWQIVRLQEPIYEGKRLSVWLEDYEASNPF